MTCVWTGILQRLKDYKLINTKITENEFAIFCINSTRKTPNVLINDTNLTEQQQEENYEAIQNINTNLITEGYWCSTSDPLLCLICDIYDVNIVHDYRNTIIKYKKTKPLCTQKDKSEKFIPKITLFFCSDRNHFLFDKNKTKKFNKSK